MVDKDIDPDMECLEDGNDRISLDETIILKAISLDQLLMLPSVARKALESYRLLLWQRLE